MSTQRQLYRICYLVKGLPRGITFAAGDVLEAHEFMSNFEKRMKVEVLTLKPLGKSVVKTQHKNHPDVVLSVSRIYREGWPTGIVWHTLKRSQLNLEGM